MNDEPRGVAKVAIVTAASRGIGAACARVLHARGYRLALMSRMPAVQTIAKELDAVAIEGSVSQLTDLTRLVKASEGSEAGARRTASGGMR